MDCNDVVLFCGLILTASISLGEEISGSPTCHTDHFPCYLDCCKKGDSFCHHPNQRCQNCDTRAHLCGNSSLPIECHLFCYREQNNAEHHGQKDDCFNWQMAFGVTAGLAFLPIIFAAALCVMLRRRPVHKWPEWVRKLLCLHEPQKNENANEDANDYDVNQSNLDPASLSLIPRAGSQSLSENSAEANVEDLNITKTSNEQDQDQDQDQDSDNNSRSDIVTAEQTTSPAGQQDRCQDNRLKQITPTTSDQQYTLQKTNLAIGTRNPAKGYEEHFG